jgi:hypothetical protein
VRRPPGQPDVVVSIIYSIPASKPPRCGGCTRSLQGSDPSSKSDFGIAAYTVGLQ